ncbi:hypothetical protein ACH5RR_037797 [Cinchona calisaya]|uniref:PRA1 family protein n=1 Tax=Cinchona calisaya TaxID=153742 RepID=A0ABD2Y8J7_9GENT
MVLKDHADICVVAKSTATAAAAVVPTSMATLTSSPSETKLLISPALTAEVSRAGSVLPIRSPVETSYAFRYRGVYFESSIDFMKLMALLKDEHFYYVNLRELKQALMWYLYCCKRHSPYRCVGGFAKSMVDVITVFVAMALRLYLGFNVYHLLMLIGSTIVLHAVVQYIHVAYDITGWDAILGILMQILIYTMFGDVFLVAAICLFCLGLILYRYASYSAPTMPVLEVKNMDLQFC